MPEYGGNAELWARVEAEFPCVHEVMPLRRRLTSNGHIQIVRQCQRCGLTESPLPHAVLRGMPPHDVPEVDRALAVAWEDKRRACYTALVTDADSARLLAWRSDYDTYLRSPEWAARRQRVLERAGWICEGCGTAPATEVHHLTYKRRGRELLFDLVAICRGCHEWASKSEGHGR